MGLVRLNMAKIWAFGILLGTDPKIVIQNERKYELRLMFDDFVHFADTFV